MKNTYKIWRCEHCDGSHQEYFVVADWGESSKTNTTYPVVELDEESYFKAVEKANSLGYDIFSK